MRISQELSCKIANMGFVCTLLVIAIHIQHVPKDTDALSLAVHFVIRHLFGSIAVPFFFIVSGYFLARNAEGAGWWRTALVRRLRTLGVPFFVWCLIPFLLFSVIWTAGEPGGICSRIEMKFSSLAAGFGFNLFTNPELNRPLWYLRMLLLLVLVSPGLMWVVDKTRGWILPFMCACCWALNPGTLDIPNFWLSVRWQIFWVFGVSVEGSLYFSVGLFLARHPVALTRRAGLPCGAVGLLLGVAGTAMRILGTVGWSYCVTVSIPLVLAFVWTLIPCAVWSRHLTGNAFAIYVLHPILIRTFHVAGLVPDMKAGAFVEWAAVAAASIFSAIVIRRALPGFAAVAFGGR